MVNGVEGKLEQPSRSIRYRIVRGLLIVALAANVAFAALMVPPIARLGRMTTYTLGELARVREKDAHDGRVVCIALYETYHPSRLVITQEALDYVGVPEPTFKRYAQLSEIQIVGSSEFPVTLDLDAAALATVEFGPVERQGVASYLEPRGGEPLDTVYALIQDGRVIFTTQSAGES